MQRGLLDHQAVVDFGHCVARLGVEAQHFMKTLGKLLLEVIQRLPLLLLITLCAFSVGRAELQHQGRPGDDDLLATGCMQEKDAICQPGVNIQGQRAFPERVVGAHVDGDGGLRHLVKEILR